MRLISPNFSDLFTPNIEIKQFPDNDDYIRINDIGQCKGKDVVLFHRLYPEQDRALIQLLLMLDVLKKAKADVTLVAPYLPYARQDKIFLDGEALSAEVICRIIAGAGVKKLITFDCHFLKKKGKAKYGGLSIENISLAGRLVEHAEKKFNAKFLVISPDIGAAYMSKDFGGAHMEKVRGEYVKGNEAYRKIEKIVSNVDFSGNDVLIMDDMVSTGGTMLKAVENVRKGGAKRVVCATTHGFFLKDSLSKLNAVADYVFASDTIPSSASQVSIKVALKNLI